MEQRINEQEFVALQFLADTLIRIRLLTRNGEQPLSAEAQRTIHDLADAWHNVPRVVAEGSGLDFLINSGIQQATAVYQRVGWPSQYTNYVSKEN